MGTTLKFVRLRSTGSSYLGFVFAFKHICKESLGNLPAPLEVDQKNLQNIPVKSNKGIRKLLDECWGNLRKKLKKSQEVGSVPELFRICSRTFPEKKSMEVFRKCSGHVPGIFRLICEKYSGSETTQTAL